MKVTFNWLKEYVDLDGTAKELAERLTMLGIEVESVDTVGDEFDHVVVGEVLSREKHPNADKLSVCRVTNGTEERQIVCGASNFKVGDKVALALPGCVLPAAPGESAFKIKVGKIRGLESQGMMCSAKELAVGEDSGGIMILDPTATVGQSFADYTGHGDIDVVLDLEITPNRPDLNSVIGIAREIAAVTQKTLRLPDPTATAEWHGALADAADGEIAANREDAPASIESLVSVHVEDSNLCPRYTARGLTHVTVGPSPVWLKRLLEKVGLRSINNIVDITNFVMLETGQPLHAFDYRLLAGDDSGSSPTAPAVVRVRCAKEGETITTLDGENRKLTADTLLIADASKPIALAGIMGGENSEIGDDTRVVLLECAAFHPGNIRRTSKRLGLKTDASYRFERGSDVDICDWASRRAASLIQSIAGGTIVPGLADTRPIPEPKREISLRFEKTNQLLGINILPETQMAILARLGLDPGGDADSGQDPRKTVEKPAPAPASGESAHFRIPSFRIDLKQEVDLIEEICRLHGVDNIPPTPPRGVVGAHVHDRVHDELFEARQFLTGLGLSEAQGQTLISAETVKLVEDDEDIIRLANPLSSDMDILRPSLLPGLLASLTRNAHRQQHDVSLFEIGRVFSAVSGEIREERHLAIALTGRRHQTFWTGSERDVPFDIYDIKGLLDDFFEQLGLRGISYSGRPDCTSLFATSASIQLGKQSIGSLGQVLPTIAKRNDLRHDVLLAEIDLDLVLARRSNNKTFKPLPAYPSIRRDVAMFVPETTTHDTILIAVRQAKANYLERVDLFDVFRGNKIPAGQKSVAYAFTYRHPDRTLTDEEINSEHQKVVQKLQQKVKAEIRD